MLIALWNMSANTQWISYPSSKLQTYVILFKNFLWFLYNVFRPLDVNHLAFTSGILCWHISNDNHIYVIFAIIISSPIRLNSLEIKIGSFYSLYFQYKAWHIAGNSMIYSSLPSFTHLFTDIFIKILFWTIYQPLS